MTTASTTTKVITFVVVGALWTSLLYAAHSQPRVTKGGKQLNTIAARTPNISGESTATISATIADPLASATVVGPITAPKNGDDNIVPVKKGSDEFISVPPIPIPLPPVQPVPVLTPTAIHEMYKGVVWEAETAQGILQQRLAFEIAKKVVPKNNDGTGGVSGNRWLSIARKESDQEKIIPDTARYSINIPASGTYYLWARTYWDSGCGNSFFVNIDGVNKSSDDAFILGGDATYDGLHWVCLMVGKDMRPLQLGAGMVNINLKVREAGTAVDQFLLTQDKGFIPDDIQ